MSLLGYDLTGTATINGLTEINANNVWSDVLYYDAGTTPVNVKTAINAISVDVTALEADVLTLQGQMTTVQGQITTLDGEVNTLQSEMNTAQSDINTLQSEMNTAQADIIALYSTTAATSATVAGLVVSQAAQDVTIAAHGVSIAALQLEDASLDGRIDALEVKTSDQSWGSLTGTTFSTKTNVGATSAGVVLNTSAASEFGSGLIVGSGSGVTLNTATASSFSSGLKTSSVEPLAAGGNLLIGVTNPTGSINIGVLATRTGAINIGSTATGNAPITLGSNASTGQVVDIKGTYVTVGGTGTATLQFLSATSSNILFGPNLLGGGLYFGMYNPTASSATCNFNIGSLNTGTINFGTGAAAKTINLGCIAATNNILGTTTIGGTTNINTTTLNNTTIGNGPAAGNITLNGAINAITGTTNINTTGTANTSIGNTGTTTIIGTTNINTTGAANTSIGNTGTTTINAGTLNINGTSGITVDGGTSTITLTTDDDFTISTATALGDIFILSNANSTFTSVAQTTINSVALDVNATGAITIDTTDNMTLQADGIVINALVAGNQIQATTSTLIQSGTTTTLTSTGETEINCAALDVNATGVITIDTDDPINLNSSANGINLTSFGEQDITCGTLDINSAGVITIDAVSNTTLISGGTNTFTSTGETEINCAALDINATGVITIDTDDPINLNSSANGINLTSFGEQDITCGTLDINSAGVITIDAVSNTTLISGGTNTFTSTGETEINCAALDINASGAITIDGASTTFMTSAGNFNIETTGVSAEINITSSAGFTVDSVGAVNIGTTTNSLFLSSLTGGIVGTAEGSIEFTSNNSFIQFDAGPSSYINISAGTDVTLAGDTVTINPTTSITNKIAATDRLTITAATVTTNPTTTIANQIGGVAKQTITSASITNTVPTINSGLTYPISTTTAIGYTNTTTSTTKFTNAAANLASLSIPGAGCWLCEGQWYFSGAVYTTQTFTTISLNTTSATVNTQRQQTAYQGNVGGNYAGQVTSIFNFTGAGTIYLVGLAQNTLGATSNQTNFLSITKIA